MTCIRDYIRIVENAGRIVTADQVSELVRRIHHTPEDISSGDLLNRIGRFTTYRLTDVPLSSLRLGEFMVDDDLVDDYARRAGDAPPIIIDPLSGSIIDGTHRANAAARRGQDTIPAYVGADADPDWSDGTEELDEVQKTKPLNSDGEETAIARRDVTGDVIGAVNGIEVRVDDGNVMFVSLVADGKTVGYADLVTRSGCRQIKMVRLLKAYRGQRIVPQVLLLLAKNGYVIESDIEQTASAVKMWQYLYDEAPRNGCEVSAMKNGQKVALASFQKTVTGRLVYGRNTPYTLVLASRLKKLDLISTVEGISTSSTTEHSPTTLRP